MLDVVTRVKQTADPGLPAGTVDCDMHLPSPRLRALLPYLDDHWRETVLQRGIPDLDSILYPAGAPLTVRADWRSPAPRDLDAIRTQLFDAFGMTKAVANCLFAVQLVHSQDMAAAFARAANDWVKSEWLDREPRLRASIIVPMQEPAMAAAEIDRCAHDRRFVEVLLLSMGEMPLGKRFYWPIYEAADRHSLPVAIHAGSMYRYPSTGIGWPTYHIQDYFSQSVGFQSAVSSLICEGVIAKYPRLKFVLCESGISWVPSFLWRFDKYWTGLRMEIPWVDRTPTEIVRSNFRFTLRPLDAPATAAELQKLFDHFDADETLLFSTDYPHWQFDGPALPAGLSQETILRMCVTNPAATYPRLHDGGQA